MTNDAKHDRQRKKLGSCGKLDSVKIDFFTGTELVLLSVLIVHEQHTFQTCCVKQMHKLLGHYFSYQDFTEKQTRPACVNHCVRSEPV
jgi:hypothetical protein